MRRQFLFVCGIALLGAGLVSAQTKIPPKQILPKQFKSWQLTNCLFKSPDFGFWKEAGLSTVNDCEYSADGKNVEIRLAQYHDPSSAFEVYTSLLRSGQMPTNLGQMAAFDKNGVLIQEGSLVLQSTANISKEDLGALVQELEAKSELSPLPPIRTYLPMPGRIVGSERYALGPEAMRAGLATLGQSEMAGLADRAGFSSGAEAMLARYSSGSKGNGVLLLLEYPTPQLAEQHIHHLDEVLPPTAKQQGLNIVRKGSLLSMILSPSSPEYAKSLREAIDYETQVTWNEPSQTATDPPIISTLVKIIMGTGVFMVAAIVLGIAFGGVRVITKIFFPGKVFDRPNQMEILQLGLSGKRIDPSDFY
ncbi:MAG TPA: DUF6599 family protein [Candidatus Solibacter sp.]|nr:DUF6599 family protein [Candidatus Solibacter sp.]